MHNRLKLETNDISKVLLFKNVKVSIQDIRDNNPYNSIATLDIISGNFRGICDIDFDFRLLEKWGKDLENILEKNEGIVTFKPVAGDSFITFRLTREGILHVEGILVNYNCQQSLKFLFQTDRNAIVNIPEVIKEWIDKIRNHKDISQLVLLG